MEIDMLVERGDTLMLVFRKYEPFMEDPAIERVRKRTGEGALRAEKPQ
jgi:hypothetical protein